jgi:hypothetical protein
VVEGTSQAVVGSSDQQKIPASLSVFLKSEKRCLGPSPIHNCYSGLSTGLATDVHGQVSVVTRQMHSLVLNSAEDLEPYISSSWKAVSFFLILEENFDF